MSNLHPNSDNLSRTLVPPTTISDVMLIIGECIRCMCQTRWSKPDLLDRHGVACRLPGLRLWYRCTGWLGSTKDIMISLIVIIEICSIQSLIICVTLHMTLRDKNKIDVIYVF
jgi:hypothetical protein